MDKLIESAIRLAFILGAIMIGNYMGDQATIRDCATHGKAIMAGGGSITCAVQRSEP
jgi:hypothetical protein